jgi:hypothetical protein
VFIAYNLCNLWRRLMLPRQFGNWSLTRLQQRLVKTGGRLIKHARCYWLLLAESHRRGCFGGVLQRIVTLPVQAEEAAVRGTAGFGDEIGGRDGRETRNRPLIAPLGTPLVKPGSKTCRMRSFGLKGD